MDPYGICTYQAEEKTWWEKCRGGVIAIIALTSVSLILGVVMAGLTSAPVVYKETGTGRVVAVETAGKILSPENFSVKGTYDVIYVAPGYKP